MPTEIKCKYSFKICIYFRKNISIFANTTMHAYIYTNHVQNPLLSFETTFEIQCHNLKAVLLRLPFYTNTILYAYLPMATGLLCMFTCRAKERYHSRWDLDQLPTRSTLQWIQAPEWFILVWFIAQKYPLITHNNSFLALIHQCLSIKL